MSAWTIAIANHKGGVGKTTTTFNIGFELSKTHSVLLIDLDPQASLTKDTGIVTSNHIGSVLGTTRQGTVSMQDIIVEIRPNLLLAPSAAELAATDLSLITRPQNELVLLEALNQIDTQYDIIIIDCPPGIGMLSVNALYASHSVIIPTQLDARDISGIALFIDTMNEIQSSYGECATLLGILPTLTDTRTKQEQTFLDALRERKDLRVFNTIIPRSVRVREARIQHLAVSEYDRSNPVSVAYKQVAQEIIHRGTD
jgi:chromosome partitioning protein